MEVTVQSRQVGRQESGITRSLSTCVVLAKHNCTDGTATNLVVQAFWRPPAKLNDNSVHLSRASATVFLPQPPKGWAGIAHTFHWFSVLDF